MILVSAVRGSAIGSALVLGAIALAGCGGSSHASQTTNGTPVGASALVLTPMTHKEFVATLDAICKRGNTQAAGLQKEATKAANAGDYVKLAAVYEQALRNSEPLYAEINRLTAPPDDAAAFARYKTLSIE